MVHNCWTIISQMLCHQSVFGHESCVCFLNQMKAKHWYKSRFNFAGDYNSKRQHLQSEFSDLQSAVSILDSYLGNGNEIHKELNIMKEKNIF